MCSSQLSMLVEAMVPGSEEGMDSCMGEGILPCMGEEAWLAERKEVLPTLKVLRATALGGGNGYASFRGYISLCCGCWR